MSAFIEIFHKAFDNELSIGHDILTCTVNNYTDTVKGLNPGVISEG